MRQIIIIILINSLLFKNIIAVAKKSSSLNCYPQFPKNKPSGDCTSKEIKFVRNDEVTASVDIRCCSNYGWLNANTEPKRKVSRSTLKTMISYLKLFKIKDKDDIEVIKDAAICMKKHRRLTVFENEKIDYMIWGLYFPPAAYKILNRVGKKADKIGYSNTVKDILYPETQCFAVTDNKHYVENPTAFKDTLIMEDIDIKLGKHYFNMYGDNLPKELMYECVNSCGVGKDD